MSSSFDTMGYAVKWLQEATDDDAYTADQVSDVFHYLAECIDRLHDHSHRMHDAPNRAIGRDAELLRMALKYEDGEARARWLKIKDKAYQ